MPVKLAVGFGLPRGDLAVVLLVTFLFVQRGSVRPERRYERARETEDKKRREENGAFGSRGKSVR